MQPADKCESKNILVAVVYFAQLTMEIVNVRLETVGGSHLDREDVVVVLLELLAGVLREEQLGEILEFVYRPQWKRVKPIRGYSFQTGGEDSTQDGVVTSIDHHLVQIRAEMLSRIAQTVVAVKRQSCEFV